MSLLLMKNLSSMDNVFKLILKNLKDIHRNNQFDRQIIRSHYQLLFIHKVKNLCHQTQQSNGCFIDSSQFIYQIIIQQNVPFTFLYIHCTGISLRFLCSQYSPGAQRSKYANNHSNLMSSNGWMHKVFLKNRQRRM